MFKGFKKALGVGSGSSKNAAEPSRGGDSDGSPDHNMNTARMHVDPGVGMAASELHRKYHQHHIDSSRDLLYNAGHAYLELVGDARKVINSGLKPGPIPSKFEGGGLTPQKVEKLTKPYSKKVRKAKDHANSLDLKAQELQYPIDIYRSGNLVNERGDLLTYQNKLNALKEKWTNPPHEHPSIQGLPLTFTHPSTKAEAISYLDGEQASMAEILGRH